MPQCLVAWNNRQIVLAALAIGVAVSLTVSAETARGSAQTFRAGVDLIAVDAQVTDRTGQPVPTLGPSDFEVTLNGRTRRVVSATFTQYAVSALPTPGNPGSPRDASTPQPSTLPGRTFVIAIDTSSFRALDVRAATSAADRFTRRLSADDDVGLLVLPDGPKLQPSTRHASVREALTKVFGRRAMSGPFEMSVEEVVDITTAMSSQSMLASRATVGRIISSSDNVGDASDGVQCTGPVSMCTEQAMNEAMNVALALEQDVTRSLMGIDTLLRELQELPGRKTVLLLSGGMPVSDRNGGRPSFDDELKRLGERATYANASINTIFFDPSTNEAFAPGGRRSGGLSGRARGIYTRALSQFSEPSGGMFLTSSVGAGESEIDRIATRLASYYVLGVAPEDRDRDGRPHRLEVRVRQRNLTVSNRQLVIVPRVAK